jgi:hypothetical protein
MGEKWGKIYLSTENGVVVCEDADFNLSFVDKNLKTLVKLKSFQYSAIQILQNHIWVQTGKEGQYTCYTEKGVKTGTFEAETVGKHAYGHIPFLKNGLWGLATESGKTLIKPSFVFNETDVPEVLDGYWHFSNKLSDGVFQFDFYNFKGKLVLSTTGEKDGWDYLIPQENYPRFYKNY